MRVVIDRSTRRLVYEPGVDGHQSADEWLDDWDGAGDVWDTDLAPPCFLCGKSPTGIGFVPDVRHENVPLCHPEDRRKPSCLQRWRAGERPSIRVKALPPGVLAKLGNEKDRFVLDLSEDGDVIVRREDNR